MRRRGERRFSEWTICLTLIEVFLFLDLANSVYNFTPLIARGGLFMND